MAFKKILIFCLAALLTFSRTNMTLASSGTAPAEQTSYYWLQDILYNNEDVLLIFMPALVGGLQGKLVTDTLGVQKSWQAHALGFSLGAAAGIADNIALYFNLSTKHYLSAGTVGLGMLSTFTLPHNANSILGFILGALYPTGIFKHVQKDLIHITQGALVGGAYENSRSGIASGMIAGGVDSLLMRWNVTSQPYLTNALIATVLIRPAHSFLHYKLEQQQDRYPILVTFFNTPFLVESLGVSLGTIVSINNPISTENDILFSEELLQTLEKIYDKNQLEDIIEKFSLTTTSMQVLSSSITLTLTALISKLYSKVEEFKNRDEKTLKELNHHIINLAIFLIPAALKTLLSSTVNSFYSDSISHTVRDNIQNKYLEEGVLLQFSQDPEYEVLLSNLNSNIDTISKSGSKLILSLLESHVTGIYNIGLLASVNSFDIIVYLTCYDNMSASFVIYLTKLQKSYNEQIKELDTKINNINNDLKNNIALIEKSGQRKLLIYKLNEFTDEMRRLTTTMNHIGFLSEAWQAGKHASNFIVSFFILGQKLESNELHHNDLTAVQEAIRLAIVMTSWFGKNAADVEEIQQSIAHIEKFLEKIHTLPTLESAQEPVYTTQMGDEIAIEIENFSYGYKDKDQDILLGKIDHFVIPKGIYAVSGESGSGKSTFLSKVQQLKYNGIWGQGNINYVTKDGQKPFIFSVSQDDYLPPYTALSEFLISNESPSQEAQNISLQKIEQLLKEIKIDDKVDLEGEPQGLLGKLNSENWKNASPGQRKKLMIIRTILAQPDIAIMDEAFNGLDTASIKNAQKMLKKYLPNTLFLIVDHHYKENNHGDFYKEILYLEKKTFKFLSDR